MIYTAEMFEEAQNKLFQDCFERVCGLIVHAMNKCRYVVSISLNELETAYVLAELQKGEHFSGFDFKCRIYCKGATDVTWEISKRPPSYEPLCLCNGKCPVCVLKKKSLPK